MGLGDSLVMGTREAGMVVHILMRIYKYRISSRIRWMEEHLVDVTEELITNASEVKGKVENVSKKLLSARKTCVSLQKLQRS